ncbi:MAG: CrcB family protein, partial [bacterium]
IFLARGDAPSQARLLLLVGVLGGFTSFSTFSLDTLRLAQQGSWWPAFLNVALSVGGSLGAAWAGYAVAVRM